MPIQTIHVNGAELTYHEEGAGDPIVFINGTLGDYRTWRRQMVAFSATYRAIAVSQRYYWPNSWPDDGTAFGISAHAADLAELLRQLKLPPVHLIGHSYGGAIVTQVALEHPELVRSLILGEPALGSLIAEHPDGPPLLAEFAQARRVAYDDWQAGHHAKALEENLTFVFGREHFDRVRAEHYEIMAENGAVLGAAYRPRPPAPSFTEAQVRQLRMPTLLIAGSATKRMFGIICDTLAGYVPWVDRVTLADASHTLGMEVPDAFNRAILDFLVDK